MQAYEEWQRLQQLFELALRAPHTQRENVLEQAGADAALKSRILHMIRGVGQELPGDLQAVSIDRYCDARHLDVRTRVGLLIGAGEAIARLLRDRSVNRDFEAADILVTDAGVVTVIDPGADTAARPSAAAPATRALGGILFCLLSGGREPVPGALSAAVDADRAMLRGVSAPRLRRILRGDIGWIVDKCLQSQAAEPYASVDALLEDLRCYLRDRPVSARPHTTRYLLGRFIQRLCRVARMRQNGRV